MPEVGVRLSACLDANGSIGNLASGEGINGMGTLIQLCEPGYIPAHL